MSVAAIVIALLVWRTLPAFLGKGLDEKKKHKVDACCKYLALIIAIGGIAYGFKSLF